MVCDERHRLASRTIAEYGGDIAQVMGGLSSVSRLLVLSNLPIQARVLRDLMDGDRTVTKLVLSILNLDYKDEEYRTHQSRVRRAMKKLESSGFVSKRKLLGREKTYGITVYGTERIASIIPDMPRPVLLNRWVYVLYTVTAIMGVVAWLVVELLLVNLFSLLLGMAALRSIYLVKRVV